MMFAIYVRIKKTPRAARFRCFYTAQWVQRGCKEKQRGIKAAFSFMYLACVHRGFGKIRKKEKLL